MDFKDLGLSEATIKAIEEIGIAKPTTVQTDVIPSILAGKDIFTIAPERCGKTCSYVFPLIDIISRREGQNILIITAGSAQSVSVSDRLAVFNKYHEINEETLQGSNQEISSEANVIIASPDLLLDIAAEGKVDLSSVNILVVDDINLIKKKRQLANLEKVLEMLPSEKQNIVFTNRRSKETQGVLDKILKTPAEIKVDRNKEDEAQNIEAKTAFKKETHADNSAKSSKKAKEKSPEEKICPEEKCITPKMPQIDPEAAELAKRFGTFGDKTPEFLLIKGELVHSEG